MPRGGCCLALALACAGRARAFHVPAPRARRARTRARLIKADDSFSACVEEAEVCEIPISDDEVETDLLAETVVFDFALRALPIAAPLTGYVSYERVAACTRWGLDRLASKNWDSVDGGQYEMTILTPTINGIVVPMLSIALATLTATTIQTLRQRQLDVRFRLNAEVSELQLLRVAVDAIFEEDAGAGDAAARATDHARCTLLLRDYTSRLIGDCRCTTLEIERRADLANNELSSLARILFRRAGSAGRTAANVAVGLVQSLGVHRASRLAGLTTAYPAIHFGVLGTCAGSIVFAFLIESDQEVLKFLDALQLRLLFSMLIGTFASLSALVIDLSDPYRGAYRITPTVAQLFPLRQQLAFDAGNRQAAQRKREGASHEAAPGGTDFAASDLMPILQPE
ncbi:hypothetical protein M885DRAFT_626835 [Pelagophyceae sp. CCMP2097]|nr:hypothetical protein M885DRAFT_626835 [Pelagophyceae sp. CCMP2097]|mmetsp:Transcript_13594/g.48303  ORF Transcript_13594/g.48303 Transcript_13594/m.48303 type:complete len:399 (-) Transcript_13594:67-1263(-)